MAASYGAGGQSPPVIGRPVDRVFEDAQFTGEVNLSGRKLKDYPKICTKYDLADTIHTDLSKNRFSEVPTEVCDYCNMERLNCYHNIIKSIPEAIVQLQALTHLNLSRNQLTVLPVSLCALSSLEVLLASNNKLVSLPEEIGKLERLMDLDVSCNEISHLPPQIGDLRSLRSLNLRRNLLVELPLDICKLNLRRLDIASNRVQKIPTVFRKMEVLEEIVLEHNPLESPPAHICTRGRQHIMKYLHTEAIKEDRKRGILSDSDMKRLIRKSLPPQQTSDEFRQMLEAPEAKWKRHTVLSSDSGYSTADSLDKCGWNHSEQGVMGEVDENSVLALKAAEAVREQRQQGHGALGNFSAHIPSDLARARLHHPPPPPPVSSPSSSSSSSTLSNRSVSPLPPGVCHGNIRSASPVTSVSVAASHGDFAQVAHGVTTMLAPPSPLLQRYSTPPSPLAQRHAHAHTHTPTTPPSPLAQRHSNHHPHHNHHQHHMNHQPLHQRQTYPPHYHSHPPAPLTSLPHHHPAPRQVGAEGDGEEFPPPPAPLAFVEEEELTPPVTPPTPLAQQVMSISGSLEDEFSRELQRQKQEYEQRKKAAEQIRLAQEEKEREERRRTAQKLQEEQRAVLERQREEQQRREAERVREEQQKAQEQQRLMEEQRLLQEQARQEEEARLREEARRQEEERARAEVRQQEEEHKNKAVNKRTRTSSGSSSTQRQLRRASRESEAKSSVFEQPPAPPWGLHLHDSSLPYASDLPRRYGNDPDSFSGSAVTSPRSDYILSEQEYRNALSSQSAKEQRRLAGSTQYRRTASDTVPPKRGIPTAVNSNSHGDAHNNHINKNGLADDDGGSISPSHSNSKPTTPTNPSHPSVWRLQGGGGGGGGGERASSPVQSPSTRHRSKPPERSSVPTPTSGRSVSRTSSTSSVNSVQSQGSTGGRGANSATTTTTASSSSTSTGGGSRHAKNHPNPENSSAKEEEFKAKHQQVKAQHQVEAQRLKSRLEDHRSKGTSATSMGAKRPGGSDTDNKRQSGGGRSGATTAGRSTRPDQLSRSHVTNGRSSGQTSKQTSGAMKMLEEYKDVNPNFTIRRREEQQREENQQLEMLRQTIESRLKVTLPDNLPEALRDGVVLCHLANQIRPRSVASIHVPSPAVPKLTSAKCRRNVENFLDACRKIGVDQEQICVATDIMEERGVQRVAITVAALVAIGSNPRQSAV
ncbi:uncharacterized protein LOC143289000 [Babylonia areolata]|uniref:uncharacterized protein LOC143289000 n=1 Tax=Babylonia areolata TaxID=304850 RepID=UPI003FD5579A